MKPAQNKPEIWDNPWMDIRLPALKEMLEAERFSIRWQRIRNLLQEEMSGFAGLKMAEIGAGTGTHSPLLAEVGSEVTIFDCSKKALEAGKRIFALQGIQASSMQNDALSLPSTPFMTDSISLCLLELLNILALPEIPFPL